MRTTALVALLLLASCGLEPQCPLQANGECVGYDAGQLDAGGRDAGSSPAPYAGPWLYDCTGRCFNSGVDPFDIGAGTYCAYSPSDAETKSKANPNSNGCSITCNKTSTKCS